MMPEGRRILPLDALEHPPAGYRRDHRSTVVTGMGFERAAAALRSGEVHPESGIEQFAVTRTGTGLVRFHLDVVSRPAAWYSRLGAPVSRLVQELITRRYLRALSVPAARRAS